MYLVMRPLQCMDRGHRGQRGQRTTLQSWFSLFTIWVAGIKLRLQAWQQAPSPTCWALLSLICVWWCMCMHVCARAAAQCLPSSLPTLYTDCVLDNLDSLARQSTSQIPSFCLPSPGLQPVYDILLAFSVGARDPDSGLQVTSTLPTETPFPKTATQNSIFFYSSIDVLEYIQVVYSTYVTWTNAYFK